MMGSPETRELSKRTKTKTPCISITIREESAHQQQESCNENKTAYPQGAKLCAWNFAIPLQSISQLLQRHGACMHKPRGECIYNSTTTQQGWTRHSRQDSLSSSREVAFVSSKDKTRCSRSAILGAGCRTACSEGPSLSTEQGGCEGAVGETSAPSQSGGGGVPLHLQGASVGYRGVIAEIA
mgnify:FL=1